MRILIVDDHEIVRKGLQALIELQTGWEVCGEAGDGREAVEKAVELHPDVVFMDVMMPELNGVESVRRILALLPATKILMLSMHNSEAMVKDAVEAGAKAYLLKMDVANELVPAMHAVLKGRSFISPKVERTDSGFSFFPKGLTRREREVLQLIAEGETSKEVASSLNISVKTVETHRTNIMQKLNLHCVTDLTRYAIRNRIVES
ncbi:MAG: response regulator [Terriglobia bacterium]